MFEIRGGETMKKKIFAILLSFAMIAGTTVGCKNENSSEKNMSEEPVQEKEESSNKEISELTGEGKKIGITINGLDSRAAAKIFEFSQEKAKELGFEVMANNANGTIGMADDIENFTEAGCDVIAMINADASTVTSAVKEAADKGVKIISNESGYMEGVSTLIGMDNYSVGAQMAQDILSSIGYSGKIVTTGHNEQPSVRAHYKIYDLIIQEYANIEKVGTVYTTYPGTTEVTYNGLSALFAEHPDIKAVMNSQDLEALGVIQVTKELGIYPKVKCSGLDGELDVLYDIKNDGAVVSTYAFDSHAIAELIVDSALRLVNDQEVPSFQESPYSKITKENVDQFIEEIEAEEAK